MVENDVHHGFMDGEGPFVTGAFRGEYPGENEDPGQGASAGEYPEIYNERESGELYEGPSRPAESAEAFEGESPFMNEDDIVRELSGDAPQAQSACRCACCAAKRPRPPAARRRPAAPAREYEDTGSGVRTTLSRGSRGQAVMDLQSGLSRLGFNPGPIDGIFGSKTEGAVIGFQQSRGLTGTGVVDASTWAELDKALGSAPSPGGDYGPPSGGAPAASATAAAIVAEAQKHLGFQEGPNNQQPFSELFGVRNVPWCAYFVSYVHTKVGIPLSIGSTVAMLSELQRRGRFFTSTPSPGDIVVYDWTPGDGKPAEHVGIVESVTRDGSGRAVINTIEGNTSNSVARRSKPFGDSKIVGYGRLWDAAGSGSGGSGSAPGGSGSTPSGAAPCAHAKPTATVNPYLREFTDAAARAGVPSSWASDPALIQLVGHESGWKPGIKNPSSSAFGLFQFIKSTWQSHLPEVPYGTPDPMWQAVGGYRYIKAAYRTPDRAWAFWQSTVCKNASLAPSDLQSRARTWISKGYAGY